MIKLYTESSLATSEIFNGDGKHPGLNNMSEPSIKDKAVKLIKTAKHITNEDIEAAYISVKQITDTLTRESLKEFDKEKVVLIYNNIPSLSIVQAVPFLTLKTKNGYSTFVFVDKYIRVSREGITSMDPSIFRDLITAASISNGLKNNYNNLQSNMYLQQVLMDAYCQFFCRVLNREFSFAPDKQLNDKIRYWVNKFFLINVFNSIDTEENIDKISSAHITALDEIAIQEMKRKYTEAEVHNVSSLLSLIRESATRMGSLTLSLFMNDWVNYYYAPAMLAVDNIEYLIFMIITLLSGNNIINISASEIIKNMKNIKPIRSELLKLL